MYIRVLTFVITSILSVEMIFTCIEIFSKNSSKNFQRRQSQRDDTVGRSTQACDIWHFKKKSTEKKTKFRCISQKCLMWLEKINSQLFKK